MRKNKPLFAVMATIFMLSLFLAACGGTSGGTSSTTSNSSETAAPASETAAKQDEKAATTAENSTRSFETSKGTIQIPTKPKRIVTDYYGGELIAVGGNVVGVEPEAFKNPFIIEQLKKSNAQDVGTPVNVEKVLETAPDLIVVMYDKNYDALSKIAPTLYLPYGTTTNIYDTVRLFGDIVGDKEKAEQFLADFDKKAAEGRAKLKGVIDENATVGLYELTNKGELWIFGDNAGRGGQTVYNALKMKMPHIDKASEQTVQLSMETLPQYAADYMFLTYYNPDQKEEALNNLTSSAIWKGLPAFKKNQIFFNDFDTYYRYDPIAVTAQIDLFVDMLLKRAEENKKK
ncbi:ABC transporter substrate-binding protein [Brevibacillus nitrificans]|uniref:ABC transporter substrate-binding protein n=1 Tax=Brevibacillus nitrificans TaxID=651560 RepID=UPI00285E2FF3|nr:ABC transporter substrate-binding protein [Brevibacillus nitrificans]MDR7317170.1 iron complex transport system substrate-binding protein [Brevibacillus nitrificans]